MLRTTALFSLLISATSFANSPAVPGEYIVKLKHPGVKSAHLSRLHPTEVVADQGVYKITIDSRTEKAVRDELTRSSEIAYMEPNYIYSAVMATDDPKKNLQWGLFNEKSGINVEKAWDISRGSDAIVVGVIDTGVDFTHPDLEAQAWTNEAEANGEPGVDDDGNGFIDDIHGYNFVKDNGNPKDDNSHGTHCAGIIGANTNNGIGIASPNWNVSIMAIKFLSGSGSGTLENAVKAIEYGIKMKAKILSNSWGGGGFSQALADAIQHARDEGILFTAAAGNSSANNDRTPFYPASYGGANLISVAATSSGGALASFSNFGKNTVDIAAPGENIYSTTPNGHYEMMSGTSMATPLVSGVAAQVWATNPQLTYAEVKTKILTGARPVKSLKNKVKVNGTLDAYGALTK